MTTLKDGTTVSDPRLDRLIEFDERSRGYPIRPMVARRKPRSYTWRIGPRYVIDQGREGACVGFAVTNELVARPAEVGFADVTRATTFAKANIYWQAQRIDPWDGGAYPGASPTYEGTSVLAGMKIAQELGYFESYRWSFALEDLVLGLGHHGPAILGVWWTEEMYQTDERGFIWFRGRKVGGHAILARAVKIVWKLNSPHRTFDDVDLDKSYITLRNSWGRSFGLTGDCRMALAEAGRLLDDQGEAVFAVKRTVNV